MQDLQEVTQEVHYENYRSERLAKSVKHNGNSRQSQDEQTAQNERTTNEKDRILLEKDAELKRMQEMLAQMQAKMKTQH